MTKTTGEKLDTELEEASREADTINGVPVWQLQGVNPKNLTEVRETDIWIHLSDLGAKGWGLMGSATDVSFWREHLGKAGVMIEPWNHLPYKPWGKKEFVTSSVVTILLFPTIIGFVISIVTIIILGNRNKWKCRNFRYAMGLSGIFSITSIRDNYPGRHDHS